MNPDVAIAHLEIVTHGQSSYIQKGKVVLRERAQEAL